ncbi:MAG TPA: HD-GYP domain-containing protein [Gemmatimonadaceae bacterium]|nr:HD-GYP domain-containing protein [Gemmatimonadaceae bacterium]
MSIRIRVYVTSLVLLASATFAWVYRLAPELTRTSLKAAVWFALLALVSGLAAYKKGARRETGSIAFLPMLASVIVAPSWITVACLGAATVVVEAAARRVPIKGIFNVAQAMFWVACAILAYRYMGGAPLAQPTRVNYAAFAVALAAFAFLHTSALAGAISISEGKSFFETWWGGARVTVIADLLTLPFVYVLALLYVYVGPVGAIGFMILAVGYRHINKVNWQLEQTNQELLQLMVAAIEARDPYTSGHSRRVSRNARLIAQAIGLRERQVERVAVAALLHDVGKIHEVFAPILSKPGRLTAEENAIMQTHPIKSEELARTVSQLSDVVAPIRHHHENWDGTGYPDGLVGEQIPLASRIIMFADTIDAMTTDRPYRAALTEAQVRSEFEKLRGRQFDPNICDKLLNSAIYPKLFDQDLPLKPAIAEQERRKTPNTSRLAS